MARTVIDPVSRVEGHLRVEVEVEGGKVTDAWVCGENFRGMELVVVHRHPEDAVQIVQRLCGLCPISHAHSSAIAAERAYGITISNSARVIRNIYEAAQIMRSNLLWFYNLAGLDYINPLNAVHADVADAYDAAREINTMVTTDLYDLKDRLVAFAKNGQLSTFSGNWFGAEDGTAYKLPPELDLVMTAHYFDSLQVHAKIDELIAVLGGKMPHGVTLVPGGFLCYPTPGMLEDLRGRANEIYRWFDQTLIPDALAWTSYYPECREFGHGCGRYVAFGVLEGPDWPYGKNYEEQMIHRYLPMGIVSEDFGLENVVESKVTEYMGHSWYQGTDTYSSPYYITIPEFTKYDVNDRYTWVKCPAYNGMPHEAGSISRMFAAYLRGVPWLKQKIDEVAVILGGRPGDLSIFQNVMGRIQMRAIEMTYVAYLLTQFIDEMFEIIRGGLDDYFTESDNDTGQGTGFWEAPRGALLHAENVVGSQIQGYEIVIPTTWNLAPLDANGIHGPMEQALIGVPVTDMRMPINCLRTAHSFDPCTACSVHVTEPSTGRHFETVMNPWGGIK